VVANAAANTAAPSVKRNIFLSSRILQKTCLYSMRPAFKSSIGN